MPNFVDIDFDYYGGKYRIMFSSTPIMITSSRKLAYAACALRTKCYYEPDVDWATEEHYVLASDLALNHKNAVNRVVKNLKRYIKKYYSKKMIPIRSGLSSAFDKLPKQFDYCLMIIDLVNGDEEFFSYSNEEKMINVCKAIGKIKNRDFVGFRFYKMKVDKVFEYFPNIYD